MKVFLPVYNDEYHPYLDEIKTYSRCIFINDHYHNFKPIYSIVNIHWPEAIFGWLEPTDEQLKDLKVQIRLWKKTAKLVYTKHDLTRIKGTTPNFTRLFKLVEENADVFIHLGNYSKGLYEMKYPGARHEVIYHPLFNSSFSVFPKMEARAKLGIDPLALVVIAPGKIRSLQERSFVLKSFRGIKEENKVLISNNMRAELRYDFRGRVRLKKWVDIQKISIENFKNRYKRPNYIFNYDGVSSEELSLRMSAADVVLVPRINILNSGNVHLGFTYNKVTVGPAIGNIREQLIEQGCPVFNPNSLSSAKKALIAGVTLFKKGGLTGNSFEKYFPQNISAQYDKLFNSLLN